MTEVSENEDWAEKERGLSNLIGSRLTSVQFVLDYLIIGFDERGAVTSLVWPEILEDGARTRFGMADYRDKLCSLIESRVSSTSIDHDGVIIFDFENRIEVRIDLAAYAGAGERMILTGPKNYLLVF